MGLGVSTAEYCNFIFSLSIDNIFSLTLPIPSISNTLDTPSKEIFSTLGTQSHLEISESMFQRVSAEQLKILFSVRTFTKFLNLNSFFQLSLRWQFHLLHKLLEGRIFLLFFLTHEAMLSLI